MLKGKIGMRGMGSRGRRGEDCRSFPYLDLDVVVVNEW